MLDDRLSFVHQISQLCGKNAFSKSLLPILYFVSGTIHQLNASASIEFGSRSAIEMPWRRMVLSDLKYIKFGFHGALCLTISFAIRTILLLCSLAEVGTR